MNKITTDQLGSLVSEILDDYAEEVADVVTDEITKAAKLAQTQIRNTAPKNHGNYARSWSYKNTEGKSRMKKYFIQGKVVYSKSPHYRLAHLLENGHALRQGGRTRAFPHIAPAEQRAEDYLMMTLPTKIAEVE